MELTRSLSFKWRSLFLLLLVGISGPLLVGQVQTIGQWTTMSYTMPINPIHVALLHNGKILVVAGSGNCPASLAGCPSGPPFGPSNNSGALLLDPTNGNVTQFNVSWDMFCNGMVVLPDGRAFINGGTLAYDPFQGSLMSSIFDPATNTFTDAPNMAHGRWYPTVLTLGDGRIMTFSGFLETGENTNTTVEFYTVGSGWSQPFTAPFTPDLYPRLHLLPNGKVFYSGAPPVSNLFDPSNNSWTQNVATTNYGGTREYGSSVLLGLTPANNYDPVVLILGGDSPATNTTETIDLGAATPKWTYGPNMSQPRIEMNAVLLPNGQVVALGGSVNDEDLSTASLNADLYDPPSNTISSAGANVYPRLYHSVAMLLPDATVWLAGGNPSRGSYEPHVEVYQPPYLFQSDGSLATRPTITNAPASISYGNPFTVKTPDAASISSVVLIRNGTVTHAFGMDQRMVGMSFTAGSGSLTVTAPSNGNIAPPGYYMLFILNSAGVPSLASSVLVTNTSAPAPTVTSIAPNSGTTDGGTGVTITGTGFQAGATVSLGTTAATGVTVVSGTSITATTPPGVAGTVDVVVTNSDTQSGKLTQGFTYTAASNPAPTVTAISPASGASSGGTPVTITGTGFLTGSMVKLGGTAATGVTVVSSTSITATTAAHPSGVVDVVVTNSDTQSGTLPQSFTYTAISNPTPTVTAISPTSGPSSGGTAVSITGTGFLAGSTVNFGGTVATGVTVVSSTSITAMTPAHAAGVVNVVVTNAEEQSGTLTNGFTYNPAPAVTAIAPNNGTPAGGTSVTVTGTSFLPGATLSLGGTPATGLTVASGTSITATTPAHAAGAVNVVVTNPDGQTGTLANGYTYSSTTPNIGLGVGGGDSSSATVTAGQNASYTLSIGGDGLGGTAMLTCTGAPAGANCTVPASQQFNSTTPTTFNVGVTTTARTAGAILPAGFAPAAWLSAFAILGMVVVPGARASKRSSRRYLRLLPLTLALFVVSCGGGGSTTTPPPGSSGTPAGNYTLSVKATSGTTTQTISLSLIVQ